MKHIAIDMGASNGRVIVAEASADGGDDLLKQAKAMELDVCHRFPSHILESDDGIHWDIHRIFDEILIGLEAAFARYGDEIASIAVDSWGVDFTIVDASGELLFLPFHYRDQRTDGVPEAFFQKMAARDLFMETGVQIMQLNTVFQMASMAGHPSLAPGNRYLSVPDLLTYWLSGVMINERSHASTTGMFSPQRETWSAEVLDVLGVPRELFSEITPAGTIVGDIRPELASRLKAPADVKIVASGSHDTQSAAYLIGTTPGQAFLSCGTWSIIGIERSHAVLTDAVFEQEFSNEASALGGYNLLKNIMGLWILQECKAQWEESGIHMEYPELIEKAECLTVDGELMDVNDPLFLGARQQAGSMVDRINRYRSDRGAEVLEDPAAITRYIIESLAAYYAETVAQLEKASGEVVQELVLMGGGARNTLLARLTSERIGKPVLLGAGEATAIGNILIQAQALAQ